MSYFKAKMHQIRFRMGLCPRPSWESSQRSPRPSNWIWGGPTSKGREGNGREGKGREEKEERGKEGKEERLHHGFWGDGRPCLGPTLYCKLLRYFNCSKTCMRHICVRFHCLLCSAVPPGWIKGDHIFPAVLNAWPNDRFYLGGSWTCLSNIVKCSQTKGLNLFSRVHKIGVFYLHYTLYTLSSNKWKLFTYTIPTVVCVLHERTLTV